MVFGGVRFGAGEDPVEEVDVPAGELEGLDLAELVRGERGDDLPEGSERLVQALGPLPLAHVRHRSLGVQLLGLQLPTTRGFVKGEEVGQARALDWRRGSAAATLERGL